MPATPKRSGRQAAEGSRFPSEVLAQNIGAYRVLRKLAQADLAERMVNLGHRWHRATVSEVERSGRSVSTDELFALALSLNTTVANLLDPFGVEGRHAGDLDLGAPSVLPAAFSIAFLRSSEAEFSVTWEGNQPTGTHLRTSKSPHLTATRERAIETWREAELSGQLPPGSVANFFEKFWPDPADTEDAE